MLHLFLNSGFHDKQVGFAADWFRMAQKLKDDAAFLVAAGTRGGGEPRDSFNTDENENENNKQNNSSNFETVT